MSDFEECSRCGRKLKRGEVKYVIYISIVSDFDGVLPVCEDEDIERVIESAKEISEEELEREVYEEMAFLVCKSCRDKFRDDPLSNSEDSHVFCGKYGRSFN